jgi:hypothetical protein
MSACNTFFCYRSTMLRRRLILPTLVRGPLRLHTDAEPRVARAKRRVSPRIVVILVWLALSAGLYLIGNWPRDKTTGKPSNNAAPASNLPPQNGAWVPAPPLGKPTLAPAESPSSPPAPAFAQKPGAQQAAPPGELKPLRDKSNLAVFGTGLERAADLSGPAEEPSSANDQN